MIPAGARPPRRRGGRAGGAVALALSALLPACGSAGAERGWTTAVDTLAGGAIRVVNSPPSAELEPTWTLEEELRIGSIDEAGPASFGQLKGIAVADDGRMAVLDAQAQEVRVFHADGRHLATYGGKGGGPGELEAAWGLMRAPDGTLWVPDHANARMSVFDLDAGFVTSYPLRVLLRAFVWSGTMGEDGRIFKPSIALGEPRRNLIRVYDAGMEQIDSLPLPDPPPSNPKDPPGAFYWEAPGGRARGYYGVPFYARRVRAIDPRGAVWSTEPGDPSYRFKRWTPGRDTTLIVETRRAPVAVTAAERDSVIEGLRESLRERGAADQDWSKIPRLKPAVLAIYFAEGGPVWVETSSPDTLRRYDVYEPDGRYAGAAVTRLNVYRWVAPVVRGDRLWAIVTDELDVPHVVRARIAPIGVVRGREPSDR